MASAYVLINCDLGSEWSIIKEIRGIADVKKVEGIYGAYDIIVIVESNNMEELKKNIMWKIRSIPQVRSTVTLLETEVKDSKNRIS